MTSSILRKTSTSIVQIVGICSICFGIWIISPDFDLQLGNKSVVSSLLFRGFLSGGLHALSGLDHLAAILPMSIGRPWWRGLSVGGLWGLGHGMAVFMLGCVACFLKVSLMTSAFLSDLSFLVDYAVGLSLTIIGIMGIYESKSVSLSETDETVYRPSATLLTIAGLWAIFVNGSLMGLSWDSIPSLAPALASSVSSQSISFLTGYVIGTLLVMALVAACIGECSLWLGNCVKTASLNTLTNSTSHISLLTGLYLVLLKYSDSSYSLYFSFLLLCIISYSMNTFVKPKFKESEFESTKSNEILVV
eukprot:gene3426-6797_t